MRNILTITKKELAAYFASPIAYIIIAIFLVLYGFLYFNILAWFSIQSFQLLRMPQMAGQVNLNKMVIEPSFHNMSVILLFMVPFITMRLFAEEKKNKTMELLITSPIHIFEIIIGKFLASFMMVCIMLLISGYSIVILFFVGTPDLKVVLSGYLGIILMCGTFISLGIFASSLTENQIIAAVISFGLLLFFWVIGWASQTSGSELGNVLSYLSLLDHIDNLLKGLIDTKDIVFYLSFISFGIFATHRVIESQRWR